MGILNSRISLVACLVMVLVLGTDISYVYSVEWKKRIQSVSCEWNYEEKLADFDREMIKLTRSCMGFSYAILELEVVYDTSGSVVVCSWPIETTLRAKAESCL